MFRDEDREEGCLQRRGVEGASYLVRETGRGGLCWMVEVKYGEESKEHPGVEDRAHFGWWTLISEAISVG